MSLCPRCSGKLTKRKSDMTWNCKRHGVVRYINTPPPSGPMREEIVDVDYSKMSEPRTFAPEHLRAGFRMWIEHGILPESSFARAFLKDRLTESFWYATDVEAEHIKSMLVWFYDCAPNGCYGSPEKVRAWAELKRVKALANFE
jgi:hypothetical protein